MDILLNLYKKYLKTITTFKFDPIILLISIQISSSLRETCFLYLIMLVIFHVPLIVINTFYKK